MATHVLDWGDSLNPRRRMGKRLTMVVMFVDCLVLGETQKSYYSYCTKPTQREFFVPARTLIRVILLITSPNFCLLSAFDGKKITELFSFNRAFSLSLQHR